MTPTRYITGFFLSLMLTCVSFWLVWMHLASHHITISHTILAGAILVLAVVQLAIQMIYFLHLGQSRARDILSLLLAAFLILFVVIGSLWIMANLATNHGVPYHGDITPQTSTD